MSGRVRLVVLRHGQSEWNAAGNSTGWENAYLTEVGEDEATRAGTLLAEHGVYPAFVHTSLQRRTIRTADLALAAADRELDSGAPVLAAQRAALRGAARPKQGPGACRVRRAAVDGVAPVVRRLAATAQRGG